MSTIHLHADIPGDWRPSSVYNAAEHSGGKPGHSYVRLGNLRDFEHVLRQLQRHPRSVAAMDFHTHSSGGSINVGSGRLTPFNLSRFRNRGFERVFRAGARIEFTGCNAAEGPEGELLLAEFGSIFLRAGGGSVRGSTGMGIADPLYTGGVYHPTGRWITARVHVGGGVSLHNHRHLRPRLIRAEVERMRVSQHSVLAIQRSSRHLVVRELRRASQLLGPDGSRPSYTNIYWARHHLALARSHFSGLRTMVQ